MLTEFLTAECAGEFVWGVSDCASMADRWVERVHGFSPIDKIGRKYHCEKQAQAWLGLYGGLPLAVSRVMRFSGFKRIKKPRAGDVGLPVSDGRVFTAIFDGEMWVSRDEKGFVLMAKNARTLAAWAVV